MTNSQRRRAGGRQRNRPRRIGRQTPRYRFFLNPYVDVRFSSCPLCHRKMLLRKVPLVVHVAPLNPATLNKYCRYCPACDLLVAHKDQVEAMLAELFTRIKPELVGNDYLVIGTVDKADWRQRDVLLTTVGDMVDHLHDFRGVLHFELRSGWMHE